MLVDVHSHLDDVQFKEDLDDVIKRAKEKGVVFILNNGVGPTSNRTTLELAKKYEIVHAALGLYPFDALKLTEKQLDKELEFIIKNKENIFAIGECGLDYSRESNIKRQKEIFQKLIEIAKELDLPLITHSRKAEGDIIDMLEKSKIKKVILHCFSGNLALVKKAEKLGYYFSIPVSVVKSTHFQNLVKEVSISRILTETDSPYLSSMDNKRNEPAFIDKSIKKIAELKNLNEEEVKKLIFMNHKRLFFQ